MGQRGRQVMGVRRVVGSRQHSRRVAGWWAGGGRGAGGEQRAGGVQQRAEAGGDRWAESGGRLQKPGYSVQ
jgi:hypothetical protein